MPRKNREKLDVLQIGGKYKYSDLCHIFNEEQKGGTQKQAQINRWQRQYLFDNDPADPRTFILKEIYNTPLEPMTKGRKSEYFQYIRDIIVLMCYTDRHNMNSQHSDYYQFQASKTQLYKLFGFFNQRFLEVCYGKDKNLDKSKYEAIYKQFENEVFSKSYDILESVRKKLKNEQLIDSHDTVEVLIRDEHGEEYWKQLSEKEQADLMTIKKEVLEEMEIKSLSQVYFSGKFQRFHSRVLEIIREKYDWLYYREAISFGVIKDAVNKEAKQILGKYGYDAEEDVVNQKALKLNEKMMSFLKSRTENDSCALLNEGQTKYLEKIKKNPSDWLYDQCVDIMAELMGVVDNKDRIQLSDVRFQMMFGYNGALDCYIEEYRKIRAELIDELIKLPEGRTK